MEIVVGLMLLTVIAFGVIIWNIYDHIIRLNKTVNKQQEQIDELNKKVSGQLQAIVNNIKQTNDLVDISKQIALKVISIEERVDSNKENISNLYKQIIDLCAVVNKKRDI